MFVATTVYYPKVNIVEAR